MTGQKIVVIVSTRRQCKAKKVRKRRKLKDKQNIQNDMEQNYYY